MKNINIIFALPDNKTPNIIVISNFPYIPRIGETVSFKHDMYQYKRKVEDLQYRFGDIKVENFIDDDCFRVHLDDYECLIWVQLSNPLS